MKNQKSFQKETKGIEKQNSICYNGLNPCGNAGIVP